MKTISFLSLAVVMGAARASAAGIAYEQFDYIANVELAGQNGGTGWSGAWTINGAGTQVGTPGLTYTDSNGVSLPVAGNTGSVVSNGGGNFRVPASSPDSVGSTLWVSFEGRMNATISSVYAGISLFQGGTETLFLGDPNTPTNWGIDPKVGTVVTGTTPTNTQTFLVYKIDFLATSAEIRLFENPALGIEPPTTAATAFATRTTALVWDNIRMQANQSGFFDEIRIGTTYADVAPVPEPAAGGLVVLGVGAVLGCRRRGRGVRR